MTKMKLPVKLFAVLLAAAAAGCNSVPPGPAAPVPARITLTEKNNGGRLELARGDTLTVDLKSNPTTGYRWQTAAPADGVLKAVSDEFIAPDTGLCGAPGRQRLSFTSEAAGETTLRLVYVRPWEKGAPPARSFSVTITVLPEKPER